MSNAQRLSALDASFLDHERAGAPMHVASIIVFDGPIPPYDDVLAHVAGRLHLVPRFRQRLAHVPLGQGRPVWVDDPNFNLRYHLRHAGLPRPGHRDQLRALAGRLFALRLDQSKPLWELWLVDGLDDGRFAIIGKTHHCLVDGVSAADITAVLFHETPDPPPVPPPQRQWTPGPVPSKAQLMSDALLERATRPLETIEAMGAIARTPGRVLSGAREVLQGVGALAFGGLSPAPATPLNVPLGPHRRYAWVDADLEQFKAIRTALGGTVNDVVLTTVAGALGHYLRHRGVDTDELVLKALIPVSTRVEIDRGALGNRVAALWAPLPVDEQDPAAQHALIRDSMDGLKHSGQAVGAQVVTRLASFAPPTIMSQAARLQSRQRFVNLAVTNVPGPQRPLYLLGRRMRAVYPMIPLGFNQAVGIAVMSYDGNLGFGLLADYDGMPDLDVLAHQLEEAIAALAAAAGARPRARDRRRRAPVDPPAQSRA